MAMTKDVWNDISCEKYREYLYADGSVLRIDNPFKIHIAKSSLGGHAHRITTCSDKAYYVSPGWIAIRWEAFSGYPLFKF